MKKSIYITSQDKERLQDLLAVTGRVNRGTGKNWRRNCVAR